MCSLSLVQPDGLVSRPGAMETAASEPVCAVDGGQLHLSLPHHDGWHDAHETSPGHLQLQARHVSGWLAGWLAGW